DIPPGRILVQTLETNRLQVGGDGRLQAARRRDLVLQHLVQHLGVGIALKRRPAREAFVEDRAQAVDIGERTDGAAAALGLFGCCNSPRASDSTWKRAISCERACRPERSILMATSRDGRTWRAWYTTPAPPAPSSMRISNPGTSVWHALSGRASPTGPRGSVP